MVIKSVEELEIALKGEGTPLVSPEVLVKVLRPKNRTIKGWLDLPSGRRYFFRSGWEMNFARYLDWLLARGEIADWAYEPKTFWFEKIRRGVCSYKPDFWVKEHNGMECYYEVKGYMDQRSRTKLKRMGIYYPDVRVIVIGAEEYKSIVGAYGKLFEAEEG
jgi:hypothetical protein